MVRNPRAAADVHDDVLAARLAMRRQPSAAEFAEHLLSTLRGVQWLTKVPTSVFPHACSTT